MGCAYLIVMVVTLVSISSISPKPIMVSFGTNEGRISPLPSSSTPNPIARERREPAPVFERREDVPNPAPYIPLVPQQYRSKLLSLRPNPNLILGTAQDQKYFGKSSHKFTLLKQQQARAIGLEYRGPQVFEIQDYELERSLAKQFVQPVQQIAESRIDNYGLQPKVVPEIGVLYSSGVRYYIPQIVYYNDENAIENSWYDRKALKYLYYNSL